MTLQFPRYCSLAFPAYRFIPGKFPHPVAHPEGHSYRAPGEAEPDVPYFPPEQWRESEAYLFGCDLYNHGYWWEAHEAWEGLWHVVPKPSVQRSFLQGIIQVTAGHMQVHLGKADGVRRLQETSRRHLDVVLDAVGEGAFMGLALAAWDETVRTYWEAVLANPAISHRFDAYPYLRLIDG
ncbi:MAG: DUF309 domain-containing protein [Phycisphaerales bacterium]|nr:DUF309 domain-containing protein [Phycisphaerales bacterium]MCB9856921.1 DUF309 domain-containing protein [Phycisphaerales bacterium]MCB9861952.1 DUF309 domain-containing protein [Phycisphaerales bacterium]